MVRHARLFFRPFVVAAVLSSITFLSSAMATDLSLHIEKRGNALRVRAVSAFDTSEFTIGSQSGVIEKLEQIYDLIERRPEETGALDRVGDFVGKQYRTVRGLIPFWKDEQKKGAAQDAPPELESLNRLLVEAGGLLFGPIEPLVSIATRIEFVVTEESLFYPFDALHVGGSPLFLKKPVAYCLSKKETTVLKASSDWRGVIIADPDTDPEKGAATVNSSFPRAVRFDTDGIRREDIARMQPVDFILVSADGGVDGMTLKELIVLPETLSPLKPKLVYFDCNLYGLNLNFLNRFSQSGVVTYVAPVFSRQTGEASAQTMIRFFRSLLNHERPSRALYLTRKTLYDSYILDGEDALTAMRNAFPFRVYQLN